MWNSVSPDLLSGQGIYHQRGVSARSADLWLFEPAVFLVTVAIILVALFFGHAARIFVVLRHSIVVIGWCLHKTIFICTKERNHPTCQQNVRSLAAHLSQFNQPVAVLFERVEAHKVVCCAFRNKHAFNTIAPIKCGGLNALNGLRQGNRNQAIAVIKCISTYIFCALRDFYVR